MLADGVAIDLGLKVRLQLVFNLPELDCLPHEGRAVDFQECRKERGVMGRK